MRKEMSKLWIFLFIFLTSGCASTMKPALLDNQNARSVKGEKIEDAYTRKKLSVLSVDAVHSVRAKKIYEAFLDDPTVIAEIEQAKEVQEIHGAPISQLTGDAIAGSFDSSLGGALVVGGAMYDATTFVYDSVKTKYFQRGYVPELVDGNPIESLKDAKIFLVEQLTQSLQRLSDQHNLKMKCITVPCNEVSGFYELDVREYQKDFAYQPDTVYVFYLQTHLYEEYENGVRDLALGFKTKYGHRNAPRGLYIAVLSEIKKDELGNPVIIEVDVAGNHRVQSTVDSKDISDTLLGHNIFAGIYSNPYMSMVIHGWGMNRLFYNGNVYKYLEYLDDEEGMVDEKINLQMEAKRLKMELQDAAE